MESVGFCLRLDAREGYADRIGALSLNPDYVALIGVKHNGLKGENPHYHIVFRTNVKPQAFRVRMKTIFDEGKGNAHMSIKQWNGDDKAISYLFHEDDTATLVVRKNITDEYLEKVRALNVKIKQEVEKSKGKASYTLEEDVMQIYSNNTELKSSVLKDEYPEIRIANLIMLTALRNDKYPPQDWLLKSMSTKILFRLQNGSVESEEKLVERLVARVYKNYFSY